MPPLPVATAVDDGTVLVLITLLALPISAIAFARSGRRLQAAEARQMLEAETEQQLANLVGSG